MVKILIVDDSGFMRMAIKKMLEHEKGVQVVGEAENGKDAIKLVSEKRPDVITMDIEMPELDGIETTKLLMEKWPLPIIMVSSLTKEGASATFKALEAGAVDYISKSSSFVQLDIMKVERELISKIKYWASNPLPFILKRIRKGPVQSIAPANLRTIKPKSKIDLIVIGGSTGGPKVLPDLLDAMGEMNCPVVVAIHMPELYTHSFAKHLKEKTGLNVIEGKDGVDLVPGTVYIAEGGKNSEIRYSLSGNFKLKIINSKDDLIKPSVNILFASAAQAAKSPVGVILTGMGDDGTEGAQDFFKRNYPVIVQQPDECIVNGMPQSAIDAGVVSESLTLTRIAKRLFDWSKQKADLR